MFGRNCDMFYKEVRFDSFVKLVEIQRQDKYKIAVSLMYNGSDLCGDVEISVAPGHCKLKDEFLHIAAETLKFF